MPESRKLCVFLCHSSKDKPAVRELYQRLKAEGWIDPWLDEEKLYPGQDWDLEIEKAVEAADAVIVFLSNNSVTKEGYIQRELRFVLRIADFKPEGTVFVIPIRLEDCPLPRRLSMWQAVNFFPKDRVDLASKRLLDSLKVRAGKLNIPTVNLAEEQARRDAKEKAKKDKKERERVEYEVRACKDKEAREKAEADESAHMIAEQKAQKERKDKEHRMLVTKTKFIRNISFIQLLKLLGIGGIVLLTLLFLIGVGNYLRQNLPTLPLPTETVTQVTNSTTNITPINSSATTPPETITVTPTETPIITPTLGIGSTMISEKDGMIMSYIPAGEFEMGSDTGQDDELPIHTVYLDAFWMSQTEVTGEA